MLLFKTGMLRFHISDKDRLKAVVSKWLNRSTGVGVLGLENETAQVRILAFFCLCMCGNVAKGLFIF